MGCWGVGGISAVRGSSDLGLRMEAIDPALCCVTPSKLPSLSGPPSEMPAFGVKKGSIRLRGVGGQPLPPPPTPGWYWVGPVWISCLPAPPCPLQVFSIVVFGSIVNEGYLNTPLEGEEFCIYNRNPNACSYGVTVGVLTFITCLLYLALDVYFPQISSVKDRKKAVLSDIGVSGEPPPQSLLRAVPARAPLMPMHT